MSKLLFRLKDVPDDEANDIRELLNSHDLDCYETDDGRWRIGVAAIWIKDNNQFDTARALIDAYQMQRYTRSQEEQQALQEQGLNTSLFHSFLERPLAFLMIMLMVALVVFISVYPFLAM
jgi:hypothetical protein